MVIVENQIHYKRCSNVEDRFIFKAFMDGFSDYMVKFDFTEEDFLKRFFGPEGNFRDTSFIAFDKDQPVGVVLGGIKTYESIKTMRCGTLAIHPNYRGKKVSHKLMELHKDEAIKHGCKQLFLEVIVGNDRAINFYKKLGYEKVFDIVYFSNRNVTQIQQSETDVSVKRLDITEFKQGIKNWNYHINWQNDLEFIEQILTNNFYGAFVNGVLTGALSIGTVGNISYLMVDKLERGKGIATQLLQKAIEDLRLTKMSTFFPNNSLLEGFFKKKGFVKGSLTQYEMYMLL
ncbi:MAG: GNAT family N-acetyltransferase [Bacillota bacterium]|nr:GNAT family N-acetyltransferase [Bacillota bacterium]